MKNTTKTIKKIIALSLIMIMTLLTLTACGGENKGNENEEADTLVLGTSADYAPFEFMYPDENGDIPMWRQ